MVYSDVDIDVAALIIIILRYCTPTYFAKEASDLSQVKQNKTKETTSVLEHLANVRSAGTTSSFSQITKKYGQQQGNTFRRCFDIVWQKGMAKSSVVLFCFNLSLYLVDLLMGETDNVDFHDFWMFETRRDPYVWI